MVLSLRQLETFQRSLASSDQWDALAETCKNAKPDPQSGASKALYRFAPSLLAGHGIYLEKPVYLVKLKPSVHSFTNKRTGEIIGTEKLRLRATEIMWNWVRDQGVKVPVHHVGSDYYVIEEVKAPPIEIVVKAAHVGTPKHRLYNMGGYQTRFGGKIEAEKAHIPYVRFDWRNPNTHPELGTPLADECIPTGLADYFINTEQAEKTALNSFHVLQTQLFLRDISLQDICFFIDESGTRIYSEISPDGLRAKWLGRDLDKDAFRKGETSESVINSYALFLGLIERPASFKGSTDIKQVVNTVRQRYEL